MAWRLLCRGRRLPGLGRSLSTAPPRAWLDEAREWATLDPNPSTRAEVESLVAAGDVNALARRFRSRIAFGTAGLRAEMGSGPSMMNDLTVIQATQGLLRYLEEVHGTAAVREAGVVVGHDHRQSGGYAGTLSSERFAQLTAAVFVGAGVPVHYHTQLVATPLVPFGVDHLKCVAGVMVTASHNPGKDNGYKVYWDNGAQIKPPHDEGIAGHIEASLEPWEDYPALADALMAQLPALPSPLLHDATDAIADEYLATVARRLCFHAADNATRRRLALAASPSTSSSALRIAYTAMHGVGYEWVERAFERFELPPLVVVEEQRDPDPTFPTVEFPNPEEGAGALELAMRTADAHGCALILANDPDADRLAVAEKQPPQDEGEGAEKGKSIAACQATEYGYPSTRSAIRARLNSLRSSPPHSLHSPPSSHSPLLTRLCSSLRSPACSLARSLDPQIAGAFSRATS